MRADLSSLIRLPYRHVVGVLFAALAASAGYGCPHKGGKPDRTPPVLTQLQPSTGAAVKDPLTTIRVGAIDPLVTGQLTSQINSSSLTFTLNGTDVRADAVVAPDPAQGESALLLSYGPKLALSDGPVAYRVTLADNAGNLAELNGQFSVDTRGPMIAVVSPPELNIVDDASTPLVFRASDEGSGLEATSLAVTVQGQPVPAVLTNDLVTVTAPLDGWAPGPLEVSVSLSDRASNKTSADFVYSIAKRLLARPRAAPASGDAPLKVMFTPVAMAITAVELYEWDFDGDGTFDVSETIGANQTFTYSKPGTYRATLRVTQTDAKQASASVAITVTNKPPAVLAEARPSNGAPPLAVQFSASATDSDGITSYEWDFEGDGSYDVTAATSSAMHTYGADGTFQPRLRVTDTLGAASELAVPSIQVRVAAGTPSVSASASPVSGKSPLDVSFSASAQDPDRMPISEWAWDFDGDGTYDQAGTASTAMHKYARPGTYYARVRATTGDGGSAYDVVRVDVDFVISLKLSSDTIDSSLNETCSIETTLSGDVSMAMVIETVDGLQLRTLFPKASRSAGVYTEVWDGKDAQAQLVPEGQYRAVVLYEVDGMPKRFDLGLTTGGVQSNPTRSPIPPTFAPLAGMPLVIDYTLTRASEVTAFIGRYDVNTRLVTFSQREERGRGTHTVVWNGENAEGQLVHPPNDDSFLFGVFAYSMPDNAIFVRSAVHVANVKVEPSIFNPTSLASDGRPEQSVITFTLNAPGSIELTIYDAETGALLRREVLATLGAGAQSARWDGRNSKGAYVAPGRYRIGVAGIDERNARTTAVYALQRVYY